MPPTRVVVLVPFWCFMFVLVAWNESSIAEPFTRLSALCLRECQQAQREILKTDLQITNDAVLSSCHRQCLLGQKDEVHPSQEKEVRNRHKRSVIKKAPGYSTCPVAEGDSEWSPSSINVTFGQYADSDDWFINVTWTPMNDPEGHWNNTVIELNVDFEKDILACYILPKNSTFFTENITAYDYVYANPIFLTIHSLPYKSGVYSLIMFSPPTGLTEQSPSPTSHTVFGTTGQSPSPKSHNSIAPSSATEQRPPTTSQISFDVVKIVAISSGVLVGLGLGLVLSLWILVRRCRSPKPKIYCPEDFKYAAFIVFSFLDVEIMNKVLHYLEKELHLKCCVHFRDFAPGIPFVENMAYSVNNSYKVVVLFSKNFLTSPFAEFEMQLAIHRMVERRDNCLVVIRIDDVDPARLPSRLITNSFIDYNSILERPFWKKRLLEFFNRYDAGPSDTDQTINNNSICYGHTDRPPLTRLCSTISLESEVSYV